MLLGERTSTECARLVPPAISISLATVWIVEAEEFGSGGNGAWVGEEPLLAVAGEVVLAATTTRYDPSIANVIAICRPMPDFKSVQGYHIKTVGG